jgi:hypothetical protein
MPPQRLHQTWKTKDAIPENFRAWRRSFLSLNPDLDSRLYDDDDNERLVRSKAPGLADLYHQFPDEIYRVDLVRPLYLFCFGGLYADLDFQCLRPLGDVFQSESDVILGRMGTNRNFDHCLPNAFMASRKHQGFWLGYLDEIRRRWAARDDLLHVRPEFVTGPVALKATVRRYQRNRDAFRARVSAFLDDVALNLDADRIRWGRLEIRPGHVFYPINWNDNLHQKFRKTLMADERILSVDEARELFPFSLAVTYWAHSWGEESHGEEGHGEETPDPAPTAASVPAMARRLLEKLSLSG